MNRHDIQGLNPELKRLWDAIYHEREMREQDRFALAKALELQAIENQNHFERLNHAHANALQAQRETVPKGEYELYVRDTAAWRRTVDDTLATERGAREAEAHTNLKRNAILAIVLGLFALLLKLLPPFNISGSQ